MLVYFLVNWLFVVWYGGLFCSVILVNCFVFVFVGLVGCVSIVGVVGGLLGMVVWVWFVYVVVSCWWLYVLCYYVVMVVVCFIGVGGLIIVFLVLYLWVVWWNWLVVLLLFGLIVDVYWRFVVCGWVWCLVVWCWCGVDWLCLILVRFWWWWCWVVRGCCFGIWDWLVLFCCRLVGVVCCCIFCLDCVGCLLVCCVGWGCFVWSGWLGRIVCWVVVGVVLVLFWNWYLCWCFLVCIVWLVRWNSFGCFYWCGMVVVGVVFVCCCSVFLFWLVLLCVWVVGFSVFGLVVGLLDMVVVVVGDWIVLLLLWEFVL